MLFAALAAVSCRIRPADPEGTFAPVGTLQGTVIDSYDGFPIEGGKVTINYEGKSQTATTDATGTFSFVDVPASQNNSAGGGGATGQYTVNLDLATVKGTRKYRPYRTTTVSVQFTDLRRADTTSNTTTAVQGSVPVSYLVSNVTFSVRQTRGIVSGVVLDEQLKPRQGVGLQLINRTTTALPTGAVAAIITTGADGKFSFTEVEEGASYNLGLADQTLSFVGGPGNTNNYTGANFTVAELGIETVIRPIVLAKRPVADGVVPYVTTTDPVEDTIRNPADVAKPIVITFSEPMNTQKGLDMLVSSSATNGVSSFRRLGPRNRPDDAVALNIVFDHKWDSTGTQLTITPANALETGYRYTIDFNNGFIFDVAGNARNTTVPFTDPALPDALAVANTTNDLQFAIGSNAMPLVVSNLVQEPDTADNAAGVTRASFLENDPSATENSFLTALNYSFFTLNATNNAYITWTAPADPVRRYKIWTRIGTNTPILISVRPANTAWGSLSGNTRLDPLPPNQTSFNMPLSDLSTVLANETAGLPGIGLANTGWNNLLQVQLGVSVVNQDGQEGDVTWVTLKDNTAPAFVKGGLGMGSTYQNTNDSAVLQWQSGCATNVNLRVVCPKAANPINGFPAATTFGQRMVQFDLSEPVDAASVTMANVDYVEGVLPNNLGIADPNKIGTVTEADATISGVFPVNVVNGRTTRIGVVFNNFFGIDTGDKVVLKKGGAGVKDIAGNVAKDVPVITLPLVDDYGPMIKTADFSAANDTITLTFTKWFRVQPSTNAAWGNMDLGQFAFSSFVSQALPSIANNGNAQLLKATQSINGAGDFQVVLQFNELGYLRGYNSTDTNCSSGGFQQGTRVRVPSLTSIDFSSAATRSTAAVNDDGTLAYENVLPDSAEPNFSPGAYVPANGLGTRSSFKDTIAPRLTSNFNERTFGTGSNSFFVSGNNGTNSFSVDVSLTEFTANENSPTATDSAINPANWAVQVVDLGSDNSWTGNTEGGAAFAQATVVINQVFLIQQNNGGCARSPRYRINFTVTNADTAGHQFGIGRVTMGAAVADMAGNAVGSAAYHAAWSYDPARVDSNGSLNPGWVVR